MLNARRIYQEGKGKEMILLAIEDITGRTGKDNLKTTGKGVKKKPVKVSDLRKRAEDVLQGKPEDLKGLSITDARSLIHELQVHQIELEMQNEELQSAQKELEESRSRFSDLV